jgi:hypothetical protein
MPSRLRRDGSQRKGWSVDWGPVAYARSFRERHDLFRTRAANIGREAACSGRARCCPDLKIMIEQMPD